MATEKAAPPSPLGDAISALDCFTPDERGSFYAAIDQLPGFDSPRSTGTSMEYKYTIDEEDWQWLASAVGSRTQQELAHFASSEFDRMATEDPDLVRAPLPPPPLHLRVGRV
jgi:hypothetical protein